MAAESGNLIIDPRSGFCRSTSIFYSKREPIPLPPNQSLDVTTFISSQAHHGKIAFIDAATGRHLTFSQLWRAVDSVATCLSDMGIRKGHVVLLLSPNSIFFPVVCLSVMSLGAIITTTNPLNTPSEIKKQIADSKPVLAFTITHLVHKIAGSSFPIVLLDEHVINHTMESKIVSTLDQMMKKEQSQNRVRERVEQDDTATMLYSSGTTGASKGVVTSHRNLIALVSTLIQRLSLDDRNTYICTVPMFHVYGLTAFATGTVAMGSTVVVLSKFEIHNMLSAIEKYRATYIPLVPPILVAMVNGADEIRRRYNLSSMKTVVCGGAPLRREVIEGFVEKYPTVTILQGYGLTESTGIGASTNTVEESRSYGTVGRLSGSMEAKIVDPDTGKTLEVNLTGELWLRGPLIMKGYFNNADATRLTLDSEGWLKTGDLCYIDEDGFIFVVDRLKELIKYKGYQVPPAELEALLLSHPEIVDAAVIPFPDKEVGQYPMAYVVRRPGSNLSGNEVMNFVGGQVNPYKRIRKVAFVDSIPKNASGKILRKVLIKLATAKDSKL
ncbi:hypothetical protein SLA2020_060860 [Shorea laevis]